MRAAEINFSSNFSKLPFETLNNLFPDAWPLCEGDYRTKSLAEHRPTTKCRSSKMTALRSLRNVKAAQVIKAYNFFFNFFSRNHNLHQEAALLASVTQLRFPISSGVFLKKKARPTAVCLASTSAGFTSRDTST